MKKILFVTLFLILQLAQAGPFDIYKDSIEAGVEIEFTAKELKYLVQDFDLELLRETTFAKLTESQWQIVLKDYLKNQVAFEELNHEVKKELTEGLEEVNPRVVIQTANVQELAKLGIYHNGFTTEYNQNIILPEKQKIITQLDAKIITPNNEIIQSNTLLKQKMAREAQQVREIAKEKENWKIINERWNQLPIEEKKNNAFLKNVNQTLIANLIIDQLDGIDIAKQNLKLRDDLSVNRLSAYKNFHFFKDGDTLEFNHIIPYKNLNEFYQSIESLMSAASSLNYLEDPFSPQTNVGIHLHLNRKDKSFISKNFAQAINYLLLLELIESGIDSSVFDTTKSVAFRDDVMLKGLISIPSYDISQLEIRVQTKNFKTFLFEIAGYLAQNENEAIIKIYKNIQNKLNNQSFFFFEENKKLSLFDELLIKVYDNLPDNEILLEERFLSRINYIKNIDQFTIPIDIDEKILNELIQMSQSYDSPLRKALKQLIMQKNSTSIQIYNSLLILGVDSDVSMYLNKPNIIQSNWSDLIQQKLLSKDLNNSLLERMSKLIFDLSLKNSQMHQEFLDVALNNQNKDIWKLFSQNYLTHDRLFMDSLSMQKAHKLSPQYLDFLFDNLLTIKNFSSSFLRFLEENSDNEYLKSLIEKNRNNTQFLELMNVEEAINCKKKLNLLI